MLLHTIQGRASEFINQDDNSRRWLNDFRTKAYSNPIPLETVDGNNASNSDMV